MSKDADSTAYKCRSSILGIAAELSVSEAILFILSHFDCVSTFLSNLGVGIYFVKEYFQLVVLFLKFELFWRVKSEAGQH